MPVGALYQSTNVLAGGREPTDTTATLLYCSTGVGVQSCAMLTTGPQKIPHPCGLLCYSPSSPQSNGLERPAHPATTQQVATAPPPAPNSAPSSAPTQTAHPEPTWLARIALGAAKLHVLANNHDPGRADPPAPPTPQTAWSAGHQGNEPPCSCP